MKTAIIFSMLLSLWCLGCSSGPEIAVPPPVMSDTRVTAPLVVPSGVDSVVARWGQHQARDTSFVTIDREEQAATFKQEGIQLATAGDSLWQMLNMNPDSAYVVTRQDSIEAIERFNEGAGTIQTYAELDTTQAERAEALLARAQLQFEASLKLNPFDSGTRQWLGRVYLNQGQRFRQEGRYFACAKVLERLTCLQPGEHVYWRDLGNCQYAAKQWEAVLETFRKAEEVLRKTSYDGSTAADSAKLFLYVYRQAEAHTRLYEADAAIAHFERAKGLARSPKNRDAAQSYIDWIRWDDGNIKNVETLDSLRAVVPDDPEGAQQGYQALLAAVSAPRAKDEVAWRLALVENILGEYKQAVKWLLPVVAEAPTLPEDRPLFSTNDAGELIQALTQDDLDAQLAAAEALKAVDPVAVDSLLSVLRRKDPASARRLAEYLERTGTSRPAVVRIVRGLGNEAPAQRQRAADALCLVAHSLPRDQLYYVPGENLQIPWYGVPQDPAYQRYFEDYAALLFNMGQSYLDKNRQKALVNFMQASTVPSLSRTDAFFEIARLLQNNTRSALSFTRLALQEFVRLTPQERERAQLSPTREQELYFELSQHFRNLGAFDCARSYYEHWQAF